jgi:GntR family transcriptional regulator
VRDVALALGVNPMTVSKAYSLLEAQGVLERRRGLGMLVAAQSSATSSQLERLDMLRPGLERIAQEAHQLELSPAPVIALLRTLMKESQG